MRTMVLRSIAVWGSVLLASGCARFDVATVDLCPAARPAATGVVKIEIDTVNFKANPKECYVHSETEIIWVSDNDSFETEFLLKSPDKNGKMKFKSKPSGVRNKADFKVKKVDASEKFDYNANTQGRPIDPSVIVDP